MAENVLSARMVNGEDGNKAMEVAFQRIQTAVKDGVIDKKSVSNLTANARDKFYSKDAASESGVFTYWICIWANALTIQLAAKELDSELVVIKSIKELGSYVERIAPCWCITTAAKNPEGIFKYFIDTMLDGGDVQKLWEYGTKGTHWDDKAETVTLKGKEGEGATYEEGQFYMLPQPESPDKLTSTDLARANGEFFAENSTVAVPLPMTTALSENITDINTAGNCVISQAALGYMEVDEGMNYYTRTVG